MNTPVSFPLEKEFALYPEAFELKQLGFDEPCFGYYYNRELSFGARTSYGEVVEAPTFSQVFRFFRKKYGLHHIIHCPAKNVANFTITGFNIPSVFSNVELSSYEDAELACLKKLIELVKNK